MKGTKLAAILILEAVLVMGILSHVKAEVSFPKCCNSCRSFSGAAFCDDVLPKCPPDCAWCRVVQVRPVKTFRCADGKTADGSCQPCKKQ
ncbi:uncharacterized protein LOC123413056 [Hordeum vulgare subsp. vulgare]|uniref:Predicted protein n=1 Tax=Hordeum vulgare subsp. vulgare TaxID=112509 RepID=F2DT14_HORVV|nr:uncharacterized protein LOC123413056 [Hordeum vulgare subsp. vulgare]KAI5018663.1 hypothetical protein ZWY2020_043551 [Hordeum vulgare]BAJ98235.1 predicted protein [Hordeum vulgare subsp. vulgare]